MTWIVDQPDLPELHPDSLGSVFTVGNGGWCTRGALNQSADAYRATLLSGVVTRAGWGLVYFLGGVDWTAWRATLGGRTLAPVSVRRTLDMRAGVVTIDVQYDQGLLVRETRLASFAEETTALLTLEVRCGKDLDRVSIEVGLDGIAEQHVAKYYVNADLPNVHGDRVRLSDIEEISVVDGVHHVALVAHSTDRRTAAWSRVVLEAGDAPRTDRVDGGRTISSFACVAGQTLTITQAVTLAGDLHDGDESLSRGRSHFKSLSAVGEIRSNHARAMDGFWARADVRIVGDDRAQRAVRYALWSTRIAAPLNDGASSIGAKNLSGDWYRGAVFWDMDLFQLPLLAMADPARAWNHIRYRYRRLDAARRLAAQDGYRGARYPWTSYDTGLEDPPVLGGFMYQQQHVSLAVAWGVLHYAALTGDEQRLASEGLEMLLEIGRFWSARTSKDDSGRLHIRGVTGPDEDHQGVDDNAYTNRMVAWLWRTLPAVLERCRAGGHGDWLAQTLRQVGLNDEVITAWAESADLLALPRDGAMLFQFAGWDAAPEPNETLVGLQGMREDKPTKQTDTLLLWQTLPGEMAQEDLAVNWRQHAPLCNQTSSLSFCSHALLSAKLGLERDNRRFYDCAIGIDLEDIQGNSRHGVHGAGQGGVWLATVHGYGGFTVCGDRLVIDPIPPDDWEELSYKAAWGGIPMAVTVRDGAVSVANEGPSPVAVTLAGAPVEIAPGETVSRPIRHEWKDQSLQGMLLELDVLVAERSARPGAKDLLAALREAGVRVGVTGARDDARDLLEKAELGSFVDATADANVVVAPAPDPQSVYLAAQRIRVLPWNCVGLADSPQGLEAIRRAGMVSVAVGEHCPGDVRVGSVVELSLPTLRKVFATHRNPLNPYLERALSRMEEDQTTSYAATLASGKK